MHVKLEGAHPPILLRARSPRLVKIGVKIYSTAYTRNIRISVLCYHPDLSHFQCCSAIPILILFYLLLALWLF